MWSRCRWSIGTPSPPSDAPSEQPVTDLPLHQKRDRADSFGAQAEQYDRVRPGYPPTMVDFLLSDGPRTVLDVGCGTGIASRLFIDRGCDVLGLEPDARMAEVARQHGLTVEEGTIEGYDFGGRQFDLLVAGQSWHWVEPVAGARKAAAVLRPSSRIGLFWNQANTGPEVRDAIQEAYDRQAPELGRNSVLLGMRGDELYTTIGDSLSAEGSFEQVTVETFQHSYTYTTEEWLELTVTHSDHRTLPEDQLGALLADLRTMIDGSGGAVPVRYETTLVTGIRAR
jgi:SAM-dependent methyltransferase